MTERHPLWEQRLVDYVLSVARRPHCYGQHDCMLHVGSGAEAITGLDFTTAHRGKYRSQAGAVRHLARLGFESPEAYLDGLFEAGPIGLAQRGDIALTPANPAETGGEGGSAGWAIPGLIVGDVALVIAAGDVTGLYAVPLPMWLKAWRVGW